ncbi:hypothetical protein HZS_641, partial [Henneguya salminicola]
MFDNRVKFIFKILIIFLFSEIECNDGSFTLVADINVPGVVGSIIFTQENKLFPIFIRTQLQPKMNNKKYGWEIHQMPILWDYSDEDYCKNAVFNSPLLHNLTERHGLIYDRALYNDEFLTINSFKESISGNSLILIDPIMGPISCSTILPLTTKQISMVAELSTNIAGKLYFLSNFDANFNKTLIIGNLYYVNENSKTTGYDWYIGNEEFYNTSMDCMTGPQEDEIFDPANMNLRVVCNPYDGMGCMLGDMAAKHGLIIPGTTNDWSTVKSFTLKDPYLPLEGVNSIAWHAIYIMDLSSKMVVSCAVIKPVEERKYKVILNKSHGGVQDNIFGIIYFKQFTPYHSTYTKIRVKDDIMTQINLVKPPFFAIFDLLPFGSDCNTIGNIHFDQHGNVRALLSSDQFSEYNNDSIHNGVIEIGFISGYTLFGRKSILGKTVAVFIKFPQDVDAQSCGQILPNKVDETLALIANFSSADKMTGYAVLIQYLFNKKFMQFSDTFLTFNLYNKNGYITKDHKYHIHQNPPNVLDVSGTSYTVDCSTTGPHYNPYNVSVVQPMYEQECKGDFMERCEVGDLNGKHGLYEVGRTRKQFIDTNLKLYGPQSSNHFLNVVSFRSFIGCARRRKTKNIHSLFKIRKIYLLNDLILTLS